MGYFHAGHVSLMTAARAETDFVVVSNFVNPTQFGPGEDLTTYPRDPAGDAAAAAAAGVDLMFSPSVEEMYPAGGPGRRCTWPGSRRGCAGRPGPATSTA